MSKKNTLLSALLAFALIILVIGIIRFTTSEDTWLCQDGTWVKHGQPSAPQPTTGCGKSTACTMEAKICADGSAVGRSGPDCEFTPCPEETNTNLANPARVNCKDKGGTLEIRKNKNGEYSVCLFEDNRQCEEWALLRGECPLGGLKITGYENEAQIYCAITGGIVEGLGTATPMCKRIDGTYCNAEANLNGECPDPHEANPNAGNVETP